MEVPKGQFGSITSVEPSPINVVLATVAEAVLDQTSFRRVLIVLFSQQVLPETEDSVGVEAYVVRGLNAQEEKVVQDYFTHGGRIHSNAFSPEFQLKGSYYITRREAHPELWRRIPSRRRYFPPAQWRSEHLLITPLSTREGIIGAILMDDPRDGAEPGEKTLRILESLAKVAVLALEDAKHSKIGDHSPELFHLLVENCMVGFFVTTSNRIIYANSRAVELFGYPREELYALQPWWQLIHPEDRGVLGQSGGKNEPQEARVRGFRKDGTLLWLLIRTYSMEYGAQQAHFVNLWDMTEQVRLEEMLRQKAVRDPLTGLFNRHYFEESIHTELRRSQRYGRPLTLVMADLRGFKRVNDRLGHARGDEVLRAIGQIIRETLRGSDWVIRYGGDEFLLVLPETAGPVDALIMRIRSAIDQWNHRYLPEIPITVDFGWATWTPDNPRSIHELLAEADARLYEEKRKASLSGR